MSAAPYIEESERRRRLAELNGYVPAYLREGFRQCLGDPDGWTLQSESQSGCLVYRRGDETAVVPNIWYNQPVAWRIKAMEFAAERARERAAALRADPFPKAWAADDIRRQEEQARRLDGLAREMARTGKVIA